MKVHYGDCNKSWCIRATQGHASNKQHYTVHLHFPSSNNAVYHQYLSGCCCHSGPLLQTSMLRQSWHPSSQMRKWVGVAMHQPQNLHYQLLYLSGYWSKSVVTQDRCSRQVRTGNPDIPLHRWGTGRSCYGSTSRSIKLPLPAAKIALLEQFGCAAKILWKFSVFHYRERSMDANRHTITQKCNQKWIKEILRSRSREAC